MKKERGERGAQARQAAPPWVSPSASHLLHSSAPRPHPVRIRAHLLTPRPPSFSNHSWCAAVRGLTRIATSERDLAAAIFDGPHAGDAAVSVVGRPIDLVVAAGQGLIATRRTAPKVRGAGWHGG